MRIIYKEQGFFSYKSDVIVFNTFMFGIEQILLNY